MERTPLLRAAGEDGNVMNNKVVPKKSFRCAIYPRVSTDHGLEQDFNSLDAQREASEAYIRSQAHEGWILARGRYDDGGYSGASLDRPALQALLQSRPADPFVGRLRQTDRAVRRPQRLLHLDHPVFQ